MSVYSIKGKGWRYDFTLKGERYTRAWYKTKTEARQAELEKRKEVLNPQKGTQIPTDMAFLQLVSRRLDHVEAYRSRRYYKDYCYMAKRWVTQWGKLGCSEITNEMIQRFVLERSKVSTQTANKEIRLLRATFNFGKKKKWITSNPVDGIDFFPVDKRPTYIPNLEDIERVIAQAKSDKWLKARFPDTPDYLETLQDTFGRISEINRLEWADVDFGQKSLVLYTRKIDGGLTPREVRMTERLNEILLRRHAERDKSRPWVFWNPRIGKPYKDRKKFMKRLCKKAGVPYFRFHPIRHSGASVMDNNNVPMGAIQRILGHKNRTTTEIYLHSLGEGEGEAIEKFEAAREKSLTQSLTQASDNFPETLDAPVAQPG